MSISTHVLDTGAGLPAGRVAVTLERLDGDRWTALTSSATDGDGRCKALLPESFEGQRGTYKVRFGTEAYFEGKGMRCLYPVVEIVFEITDERHYHIPLLLTANGYTTYRGS